MHKTYTFGKKSSPVDAQVYSLIHTTANKYRDDKGCAIHPGMYILQGYHNLGIHILDTF